MMGETERSERWISLDDDEGGETACWSHLVDEETGTITGADHPSRAIDSPASTTTLVPRDDPSRPDASSTNKTSRI